MVCVSVCVDSFHSYSNYVQFGGLNELASMINELTTPSRNWSSCEARLCSTSPGWGW